MVVDNGAKLSFSRRKNDVIDYPHTQSEVSLRLVQVRGRYNYGDIDADGAGRTYTYTYTHCECLSSIVIEA
jgi:hypothetical protein